MTERALVISSSGVRLVYEIGALRALVEKTSPTETAWTHVYGTSGGSLLASFLCQYPVGQEKQAIRDMEKLMHDCVGDNGMREYFPFGVIQGILWNKSLHSPEFLEQMVKRNIEPEKIKSSGRHLHIIALDYSSAKGLEFTEANADIISDATIGSCSIPLVFPPHPIADRGSPTGITYLGDGGVTDFIPFERAVLNPTIGHVDAILSVGIQDTRVLSMAPKGQYPSIHHIVNTLMEGFYKMAADQTEKTLTRINSLVLLKKTTHGTFENLGLPVSERDRLAKACTDLERNTFVSCRLYRPVSPFSLTITGYEETVNKGLWDAGFCAVERVLDVESGKTGIFRTLYI